jgi:biotin synthase-related radical SAM superfamily protein
MLARVTWPSYNTETVLKKLGDKKDQIQRICIQTMNYSNVFEEVFALVSSIHTISSIQISLSCHPLSREEMKYLYSAGLQRIGIPLDASTETIFERVKGIEADGPYL